MKKLFAVLLAAMLLCACAGGEASSVPSETSLSSQEAEEKAETAVDNDALLERFFAESDGAIADSAWANGEFPQLADPPAEAPRIRMHTSAGDLTLVLYPEAAPLAAENFLTHCRDGYYDGSLFHRVIADFMIQAGIPAEGSGSSIWGAPFRNESCDSLRHFTGALSMANAGPNTNGSQFFIVQAADTVTEAELDSLMLNWYYNELNTRLNSIDSAAYADGEFETLIGLLNSLISDAQANGLPQAFGERYLPAARAYLQTGGSPFLDYGYTVFGQVIEGMDVVDAIATAETTENAAGEKSEPVDPVMILSTEVL